ncbi:MAG: long-chain fatty acid--CoA ligase [Chlorobi bacterium]|nr:long-chain fatty acid--CoA ligase [Chlorobiota bacterium]
MEVTRTFDILDLMSENYVKDDILGVKRNGKWEKFSTQDYIEYSNNFSYGLLALGLKKGDIIATVTNNRPEWNFVDMGASQAGIIHIPIYPTISIEDYKYILGHSEPTYFFVSDKNLYNKLKPVVDSISAIKEMYSFNELENVKNWKEVIELGKKNADKYRDKLTEIKAGIKPEDLFTIVYTSGTTGSPKGVMLSHKNMVTNFIETSKIHGFGFGHKALSFLPLSHVYERMVNYHFQYKGISIYYAENMATIVDDLKSCKPEIFNSVPRLLERVYDKIISKGAEQKGIKKKIFFWAVDLALKFELNRKNGWFYHLKLNIANKLVFVKWREALGGNVQIIVSGGAALQPRLARVFWAAKISVVEGYGLTETAPVIAVNDLTKNQVKFGTVGPVLKDVEVKIAEDGEILCKGPNVMLGYYKEPELTAEAIDEDGYYHTGDIGRIEDDLYLKITDRKKEIFKLSSGKYIAPQIIENKIKESIFIEQLMVVGENEKFASALIAPNFDYLHNWCSIHKIHFEDNKELIQNPKVVSRIQKEVNMLNKQLGATEQIKRFRIVCDQWSPETGELSHKLSLKRKVIHKKYDHILNEIYSKVKEPELA